MNNKIKYYCMTCGKEILQWPSQVGKNIFCSKECYHKSKIGSTPHNKGNKSVFKKSCAECGKEFEGTLSQLSKKTFCSYSCSLKFRRREKPMAEKIMSKIRKVDGCSCWFWTGFLRGGYGRMKDETGRLTEAHRVSYECFVGKIPEGLVLDHLCRNRDCVNPEHLEPVTTKENIRRGNTGKGQRSEAHKKAVSDANKRRFEDPVKLEAQRNIIKMASLSPLRIVNMRKAAELKKKEGKDAGR